MSSLSLSLSVDDELEELEELELDELEELESESVRDGIEYSSSDSLLCRSNFICFIFLSRSMGSDECSTPF